LGLVLNTRAMTVGTTPEYHQEVIDLIELHWVGERESSFLHGFLNWKAHWKVRINRSSILTNLPPRATPLFLSSIHTAGYNKYFLVSTRQAFCELVKKAKCSQLKADELTEQDLKEISFAVGWAVRRQHKCHKRYKMPNFLERKIKLILHLVCKEGGGGWSTNITFWWHLEYKAEVVRPTRLKNNKHGNLISINSLEFFCVNVNFAAAICVLATGHATVDNVYQVLLNWCNNKAACAWVNYKCKESLIGRRLALVLCGTAF